MSFKVDPLIEFGFTYRIQYTRCSSDQDSSTSKPSRVEFPRQKEYLWKVVVCVFDELLAKIRGPVSNKKTEPVKRILFYFIL